MSYSVYPATTAESKGPLDITWTNIGYNSGNGLNTYTFSGLTGYKYLKFKVAGSGNNLNNGSYRITFNSDTTNAYAWGNMFISGSTNGSARSGDTAATYIAFGEGNVGTGYLDGELNIINATSTAHKHFDGKVSYFDGSANRFIDIFGTYRSTSPISSITLRTTAGTFQNTSPYGFYVYGGN